MIATQNIDRKILEEVEMRIETENENAAIEKAAQTSNVISSLYYLGDKMKPLSKEEKNLLAIKAKQGDKEAIEKLTLAHVKMVIQVALKKYKQMYTVPINASLEDLVMAGCTGLGDAIGHFDPHNSDASFTTYAMYFITKEINQTYLDARPIRISGHIMERTIMMKKTYDLLRDVLRHEPTIEEIYEYYEGEYSKDFIQETLDLIKNTGTISLYEKFGNESDDDENSGMLINVIADGNTETPEETLIRDEKRERIYQAINSLPEREAITIKCLFGLNDNDNTVYTLVETAQILSKSGIKGPKGIPMSKQHICNIRDSALKKLKRILVNIELD